MRTKLLTLLMLVSILITGCATATTQAPATEAPVVPTAVPATKAPVVPTEVPATEPPTAEPTAAAPIALKVYVVDFTVDSTDKWLQDTVVPAFQKLFPNVTVEFVWGTWSTFGETVAGYFAAGDGPDIINLGSEFNGLLGHIYTVPISGGEAKRILGDISFESQPRFSPDGKTIVFLSDRDGAENVWTANLDGSGLK